MDRIDLIRTAMKKDGVKFLEVSEEALTKVEETYDIRFPGILKEFYLGGLPMGARFPEWLSSTERAEREIRRMFHFPLRSIADAVENDELWHAEWGEKPTSGGRAVHVAKEYLSAANRVNPLIPLVGHCYLVTDGADGAGPVLSIFGDDVVVMGEDLYDFLEKRYSIKGRTPATKETVEACGAWKTLVG